jgi:hypothetical protein
VRWIVWLLVAACSGGAGGAARPAPAPTARPTPPPADDAPGEAECDQLITHAVALGIAERGTDPSGGPPAPRSTESDHEAIRRALHDEFVAGCHALPRDAYRCAMAATTLAALAECQRTPSSSTSNSSVAPGGILPPPAP